MDFQINGTTRLTALLGSPVAHSISPLMHNEAFRCLGLDYVYLAFDIKPDQLTDAVNALTLLNTKGFNLTMPFKTLILPLLDEISPAAKLSQSVNTVVREGERLIGYTTDGDGFMQSVKQAGFDIIGKKMTLLGAGGAAKSICVQAALDGVAAIFMFKRNNETWEQTINFITQVSNETDCTILLFDLADQSTLKKCLQDSAILVNATNIGMAPNCSDCLIPDNSYFHPQLIVSDIIYNPLKTELLRLAQTAGCPCINGLPMLLYQGAGAFKYWTNAEMPLDIVKQKYFSFEKGSESL